MSADLESDRVPLRRTAVRVLPVDSTGRVLLLLTIDPARPESPFWCTVGGGIDGGEDERAAAVRELFEETGITVSPADLVGPLGRGAVRFRWGRYDIDQAQTYYAVSVDDPEVTFDHQDGIEAATTLDYRWWTREGLLQSGDDAAEGVVSHLAAAVAAVTR